MAIFQGSDKIASDIFFFPSVSMEGGPLDLPTLPCLLESILFW